MTPEYVQSEKKWAKYLKFTIGLYADLRNGTARVLLSRYRQALNEIQRMQREKKR